jgi:hypothetical protein
VGASADNPVVPDVGPQDLGQPCQVVLFTAEEPAVPVADAVQRRQAGRRRGSTTSSVADSGSRRSGSPIEPSGGIAWIKEYRFRPVNAASRSSASAVQ